MQLTDYPTTKFFTFEDKICADVLGKRVTIATVIVQDQEQWNLIQCLVQRASIIPELLDALTDVQDWKGTRVGDIFEKTI